MSQTRPNKMVTITNDEIYDLATHQARLADSANVLVKVNSQAERDALPVTPGWAVVRLDLPAAPVQTWNGTKWSAADEAWTYVPMAQGFEHFIANGWSGLRYCVRNSWVIVNGAVSRGTSWGSITCAVMPAHLKPGVKIMGTGVEVEPTAGNVVIPPGSTAASLSASWPLY